MKTIIIDDILIVQDTSVKSAKYFKGMVIQRYTVSLGAVLLALIQVTSSAFKGVINSACYICFK